MTHAEKNAVLEAHSALFQIDRLLAETYSPTSQMLEAMHDSLYAARIGLERILTAEA